MKHPTIRTRLFLVGCPRSGTTLLQSLLGAHREIASFPESHFFSRVLPRHPLKRLLGVPSRGAGEQFARFLRDVGEAPTSRRGNTAFFVRQYAREFVAVLDRLTLQQGKSIWLEKTPDHLHRIGDIRRLVPEAKFIHLLRNGDDVVASLYEVTRRYPEVWGAPLSADDCIRRWIRDAQVSLSYRNDPDHLLVRYERLVAQPRGELERICRAIGVEFDERMQTNYPHVAARVVLDWESWKGSAAGAIQATAGRKFGALFDPQEQLRIRRQLAPMVLDDVDELRV